MTYDDLLELAKRYRDQPLETVTGKRFTVDDVVSTSLHRWGAFVQAGSDTANRR